MKVSQGDIFWVPLEESNGTTSDHTHPHVVVQDNIFGSGYFVSDGNFQVCN
jgi:mRNA-degrading endonuclease toxin of MazEF toxin-antitoxin module